MLIYTLTQNGLIEGGSMTGKHTINFYFEKVVIEDAGGVFGGGFIQTHSYSELIMEVHQSSDMKMKKLELVVKSTGMRISIPMELKTFLFLIKKIDFETFTIFNSSDTLSAFNAVVNKGRLYLGNVIAREKELVFYSDAEVTSLSFEEIEKVVKENFDHYVLYTRNAEKIELIFGKLTGQNPIEQLLEYKELERNRFPDSNKLLQFTSYEGKRYYAYAQNNKLDFYLTENLAVTFELDLEHCQIYMSESYLVIQQDETIEVFSGFSEADLYTKLSVSPETLYEIKGPNYLTSLTLLQEIEELLVWIKSDEVFFYDLNRRQLVLNAQKDLIQISDQDSQCLVFPEGLLYCSSPLAGFLAIETPQIVRSKEGYPSFFEVLGEEIKVFSPAKLLFNGNHQRFFDLPVEVVDQGVLVQLTSDRGIILSSTNYKKVFKETLYHQKTSQLPTVSVERLLVSRARSISDLLLFEFFGQWQIIVDYVSDQMRKETFTEEEITHFGLFVYHATFQQRKRMEEMSNKFPKFMNSLVKEFEANPELDMVHQKQQRDMFQLTTQMKSQFVEIESLLSQISYIHYNNDEYQSRIKSAQDSASMARVGTASIAGVGLAIMTGGVGLIFPLIAAASEWSNRSSRKVMDEIQKEKEFKKNEFYFKKAIELILHMDSHTLPYYIQRLNQLSYSNLRSEARLLVSKEGETYKMELLQQTLTIYSKVALPLDYQSLLKPADVVTRVLAEDSLSEETIQLQFID